MEIASASPAPQNGDYLLITVGATRHRLHGDGHTPRRRQPHAATAATSPPSNTPGRPRLPRSAGQTALATTFARSGSDKFDGADWTPSAGLPRLPHSPGRVAREVTDFATAGDHSLPLAHVVAGEVGEVDEGRPLTYHQRSFGIHTPLPT
ncbi:flavin reductase family protein [Streptomyces sp. NPDC059092]|uniref:flavin reductase family protein n=1 Tax=Streptomyces sp. NPDC059092 TaxID=3346725 RepID=UPI0036976783